MTAKLASLPQDITSMYNNKQQQLEQNSKPRLTLSPNRKDWESVFSKPANSLPHIGPI